MFEDKGIVKFAYGILVLASIIIDGPIVPIICLVLAVGLIIFKYKESKSSPEKGMDFMLDVIILSIVIIVNIVLLFLRIGIMTSTNKYYKTYSESSYESYTADDFAKLAISEYYSKAMTSGYETNSNKMKKEFKDFLEESGVPNVSIKGNKVNCTFDSSQISFIFDSDGDISYKIK